MLFTMVAAGKDLEQVYFGDQGVAGGENGPMPRIFVDCSSIGVDQSAACRERLAGRGAALIAAPVSGNGKCVKAGKLSAVASGPEPAFREIEPYLQTIAGRGVSYVGEGELARICKIAHNVMLGVVIQNLAEITILTQKAGVPRHAFLDFINRSVMGSTFTRYKSPALVNLDWTTTFTPALLRKDLDLGLQNARELEVAMPVAAAAREALQAHFGIAQPAGRSGGLSAAGFRGAARNRWRCRPGSRSRARTSRSTTAWRRRARRGCRRPGGRGSPGAVRETRRPPLPAMP